MVRPLAQEDRAGCGLTLRSTRSATACDARASLHSGPAAAGGRLTIGTTFDRTAAAMPTEPLSSLHECLTSQNAARSHLARITEVRALCERSPHCLALALVGSFAQGKGDRISDLDLAAFVEDGREVEFMAQAHEFLGRSELLNVYGEDRRGQVAFRKYVYLDFSSCEFHAFSHVAPFKLRPPFLAVWNPHDHLETLIVNEAPPRHEVFDPYPHGDAGLIWELVDCIKWLNRGREPLAKSYLIRLAKALKAQDAV